ncbi:MAG TPA: ubiquinol-cytochrome c reductase iron-sulfur subunit [Alphaproteobacteria bacterium]|nr:ubiquinol-cytochrome c reductase iron-sulfur subunit [Alphaproteobacteria bacterium]
MAEAVHGSGHEDNEGTRRDFLSLTAAAMGAVAVGGALWPLIDSMNPAADALAVATLDVNLAPIEQGQAITVMWRGTPVFIRHRTEAEIAEARGVELGDLPDPATDEERVQKPEWLVMVGVCTHLGCIPLGQKVGENKGEYGGWFCPCHGSHYDTSGRIRRGPAPTNLPVPPYEFASDTEITIG